MAATAVQTDFSSAALPSGLSSPEAPYQAGLFGKNGDLATDFQRSWLGRFLTGTSMADYQDFQRSELSANNQYFRDLAMQDRANAFSAAEAEKQRAFEERLSNTAYQRAFADMKKAGVNPVLMLPNQGGASTPQGVAATASNARSGGSNYSHKVVDNSAAIVGHILSLVGGLISVSAGVGIPIKQDRPTLASTSSWTDRSGVYRRTFNYR